MLVRFQNPVTYLTNPIGDRLPPEVVKAFVALGYAQRGEPEEAMERAQNALGGGRLNFIIEHVGDLTHRMTHMLKFIVPDDGYGYVKDKVDKTLPTLQHTYAFARNFRANMESSARYYNVPLSEYMLRVNEALAAYAAAHAKLPVYNHAQWLAREAAIALGQQNFLRAELRLSSLEKMLKTRTTWWEAATAYQLDANGQPMLYQGPSSPLQSNPRKQITAETARLHLKNRTRYKTLNKLAEDPRVEEIWDEDRDGLWASLVPGYNWDGCSCIHESTAAELIDAMRYVTKNEP